MPSLDFETERAAFREFYNDNSLLLDEAKQSLMSLIIALLRDNDSISISKIEGRIKDREECIAKFTRKYRTNLESEQTAYSIKDHISDLIGLRVVCLYESDVEMALKEIEKELAILYFAYPLQNRVGHETLPTSF